MGGEGSKSVLPDEHGVSETMPEWERDSRRWIFEEISRGLDAEQSDLLMSRIMVQSREGEV